MAVGTTNWSVTIDTLEAWGAIQGNRTIYIRATDSDYKRNTTVISRNFEINNTNPSLVGQVSDVNDLNSDGYHNISEGDTVKYTWAYDSTAVKGHEIILYNVTDGTNDRFKKNLPASGTVGYSGSEINPGTGSVGTVTTGVTSVTYGWNSASEILFQFQGQDSKEYYIAVKPYDSFGQTATAKISNAVVLDITPPDPTGANVVDTGNAGNYPGLYINSAGISFNWSGFSDGSGTGIVSYEVQSSNDGTNWSATWQHLGLVNGVFTSGYGSETFLNGQSAYLRVRAKDKAGNYSTPVESDGILVDTTAPDGSASTPLVADVATARRGKIQWTDATDTGSGVDYYIIEITHSTAPVSYFKVRVEGDRSGWSNLVEYPHSSQSTVVDDTSINLTSGELFFTYDMSGAASDHTTAMIRIYDKAGNEQQTNLSDETNVN
jgi:hypothetical protein